MINEMQNKKTKWKMLENELKNGQSGNDKM